MGGLEGIKLSITMEEVSTREYIALVQRPFPSQENSSTVKNVTREKHLVNLKFQKT
jgi:hypothetical protein